jgi:hypothetical protein
LMNAELKHALSIQKSFCRRIRHRMSLAPLSSSIRASRRRLARVNEIFFPEGPFGNDLTIPTEEIDQMFACLRPFRAKSKSREIPFG